MRLVAPSEYRRMPWKNGGGTTYEIAVQPQGADCSRFAWRISIAEIASDGPFSSFPETDRVLVVLAGRGMRLSGIGEQAVDVGLFQSVAFPGEARVESRLLDGPTRDFNVMTRRGVARAEVRVVQSQRVAMDDATAYVCHAASQSCTCLVEGSSIDVPEAHTLIADVRRIEVDASPGGVAVVAIVTA